MDVVDSVEFRIAVLLFFFFFSGASSAFLVPLCLLPLSPYTFVEWNIGSHHLSGDYGVGAIFLEFGFLVPRPRICQPHTTSRLPA